MGIGKNLRALRERLGYTQKTVAEETMSGTLVIRARIFCISCLRF